jgi:hypothetical protein
MEIKNPLGASGVAVVVVGKSVLPTMLFQVHVARDQVERAREVIREAQAAGPAAAEEAEALFEAQAAAQPKQSKPKACPLDALVPNRLVLDR